MLLYLEAIGTFNPFLTWKNITENAAEFFVPEIHYKDPWSPATEMHSSRDKEIIIQLIYYILYTYLVQENCLYL